MTKFRHSFLFKIVAAALLAQTEGVTLETKDTDLDEKVDKEMHMLQDMIDLT